MTKKDYVLIAACIDLTNRYYVNEQAHVALKDLVLRLIYQFRFDNPKFDSEKFLLACGFTQTKAV
jgi:hypothetical protein